MYGFYDILFGKYVRKFTNIFANKYTDSLKKKLTDSCPLVVGHMACDK